MARDVGLAVVRIEVTGVEHWILSAFLFLVAFRVRIPTKRIQLCHARDHGRRVKLGRKKRVAKLIHTQEPSPHIPTVQKSKEVVVHESGIAEVEQVRSQGRITAIVKGELEYLQLNQRRQGVECCSRLSGGGTLAKWGCKDGR